MPIPVDVILAMLDAPAVLIRYELVGLPDCVGIKSSYA